MLLLHRMLALPPALLTLILDVSAVAYGRELEWPYNLPPHVKYYPEHEALAMRQQYAERKLQYQRPVGIKKLSGDPGEKFFLDYWHFEHEEPDHQCFNNASVSFVDLSAPIRPHVQMKHRPPILRRFLGSTLFEKRDYTCPAGSYSCQSVGRTDSCCANGSTCQIVQDIGLGDVGCCPENEVCGGSVSNCPGGGYTDCPQNPGGGCCLPGYACDDLGCIAVSTAVVVVTTTSSAISTSSIPSSTPPPPSISTETTTTIIPAPIPVPTTSNSPLPTLTSTTTTTTPPPTTSTSSSTSTPNTLSCSSGFRSCPASLGGGCCPTSRACGSDICPALSSTNSFTAPARPTSNSASITITSTTNGFSSVPGAACPTGFYACSAYYQGGCCQTGRNCDTTSCPAGTSITVVNGGSQSITAIAPSVSGVSSVQTLITGNCAQGWTTCQADLGGGCCAIGYACGSLACTVTSTGPNGVGASATIGKIAPNEGGKAGQDSLLALVVVGFVLFGFVV